MSGMTPRHSLALVSLAITALTAVIALVTSDARSTLYAAGAHAAAVAAALLIPAFLTALVLSGLLLLGMLLAGAGPIVTSLLVAGLIMNAEISAAVARRPLLREPEVRATLRKAAQRGLLGAGICAGILALAGLPGPAGLTGVLISAVALAALAVHFVQRATPGDATD